jgi:hypothetical protein
MTARFSLRNSRRTATSMGFAVLLGLAPAAALTQTFTLSGPEIPPGEAVLVTDETSTTVASEWSPDPPGHADDDRFTGRLESSAGRKLLREVILESADAAVVRYLEIKPESGTGAAAGFDAGLRSELLAGSYTVLKTSDSISVTEADGSAPAEAEARFLQGDFLGLLAWRSLRDAFPAAVLGPGESIELTDSSVLGLFGAALPLA